MVMLNGLAGCPLTKKWASLREFLASGCEEESTFCSFVL
jgi:hypothetical protein